MTVVSVNPHDPADVIGEWPTEEVFAPVAAVLRVPSAEAAVEIANGVRYGLVASVFTQNLGRALTLTERLDAGMVRVNAPTSGVDFQAPFGGAKQSGYGAQGAGPGGQGLLHRDPDRHDRALIWAGAPRPLAEGHVAA